MALIKPEYRFDFSFIMMWKTKEAVPLQSSFTVLSVSRHHYYYITIIDVIIFILSDINKIHSHSHENYVIGLVNTSVFFFTPTMTYAWNKYINKQHHNGLGRLSCFCDPPMTILESQPGRMTSCWSRTNPGKLQAWELVLLKTERDTLLGNLCLLQNYTGFQKN